MSEQQQPVTQAERHTPGPWTASQTYPAGDWCIHASGIPWQLAYLAAHSKIEWPLEANARLIAAAPDMLTALKRVEAVLTIVEDEVRAAIAKAEGREP